MARTRGCRGGRLAAGVLAVLLLVTACGGGGDDSGGPGPGAASGSAAANGIDDGTELTMWVRHTDGEPVQKLVDLYNSTHQNKIKLTVVPGESFQQKVGAAAGAGSLPDILGADVVYSPNYVEQGLFTDITEVANALPFKDNLSQAHQRVASKDDKVYGLPLLVDSSLIVYNKTLYKKAGLDPDKPPTSFAEIYDHAKAIRALGGKTYGFYFAGNGAGAFAYSTMPYAAAAGTPPVSEDGRTISVDNPAFRATCDLYRRTVTEDIAPSAARTDDGTSWPTAFYAGQIGILPIGTFVFPALQADADFEWGVAPLPAPEGGAASTFVGGDVVGIARTSEHPEQAVNFLSWSLSDEPQLQVWAKNGFLTPRFDLAENEYTAKDPARVAAIKGLQNGYTPGTLPYGEIFNNANGPWLKGLRGCIFDGDANALAAAQAEIQQIVDEAY